MDLPGARVERSDPVQSAEALGFQICADLAHALTYASWQNSVPLLRALSVRNHTAEFAAGLCLEFETRPAFARAKRWTLDRVLPREEIAVSERHVALDSDYLSRLNEAERGIARFRLLDAKGDELALHEADIRLLARDEWGGFASMPSLVAAFVMPNDPAVARILKDSGDILERHGHSTALDGYQSHDPARAYMLTAAIWSAVASHGLTYAEPPKSFEKHGQKVRRPTTILEEGLATCLDTTLLFAAAIEAVGLNPVVLFSAGHSVVGVWLVKKTFPQLIVTDASEVRKAMAAREFVTFETTYVTHTPPATFQHAIGAARSLSAEREEELFVAAIDIARARASQILPLASHQKRLDEGGVATREAAPLPLPAKPDLATLPEEAAEEKPSTPAGRIDRWQRKLLDLSLRNRLLNFVTTKQTVPFVCPDVPFLEDRLAESARIRVISLPDQNPHGDRDEAVHRRSTGLDLDTEFATQALRRDEISSPLEKRELDARLTELFRRARNDMNEGGSNTLFLAVGFLRWKKTPEDERSYRAPLLLVPIKLERRSASSAFHLTQHEDEVRFNATLIQMLKRDFELDLSYFEGSLPTDGSGIDVLMVLERVRRAVRDVPSFEVINETALSTFSFAKYLMWKDLVDRTDDLRNNRVVRHLIDNPDKPFVSGVTTPFPTERDIDRRYHPKDITAPLPADSSQLAAIMGAAEGQDFVLIGPPGTGKSQTITNMIAQCLASGRSVLFVAEKTAALNVVHRRSPWRRSFAAAELKAYLTTAAAIVAANRSSPYIAAALSGLQDWLANAPPAELVTRLRGMPPRERALQALSRMREREVKPERLLAIHLAVAALIEADPGSHRVKEFRIVQVAKAAHRLASGTHKTWSLRDDQGRMVRRTEMHAYARSSGRVLRYLGEMIERECELATERFRDDVIARARAAAPPTDSPDLVSSTNGAGTENLAE